MKKRPVLLIAVLIASICMARITSISLTSIDINDTNYNCKPDGTFDGLSLGNIGDLSVVGHVRNAASGGDAFSASMSWQIATITSWNAINLDDQQKLVQQGSLTVTQIWENSIPYNINTSNCVNGQSYNLNIYFTANDGADVNDPSDAPTSYYSATFTKISDISFTDGTSFTPSITTGNSNELIGRFQLEADVAGATFTDASIDLSGTRSGFSNFKLWASADASYDVGDIQLGSTIGTDPQPDPAVFSSFSLSIPTSATYILLTADVSEEASGSIQGVIGNTSDLTVTDGEVNGTITNAYMSNGGAEVPTPVTLTSFTADLVQGKVNLQWSTASEAENDHFLIIRDGEVIASVPGHGTCTEPHDYAYTDALVEPGVHQYVLADVTWGGEVTEHAPVNVEVETEIMEASFVLNKAYPNPFNPTVVLSMEYGVGSNAVLNIYNTQGMLVDQLINGFIEAGTYDITWDATNMPSGVYIVKMVAGNVMQSQKIVFMK